MLELNDRISEIADRIWEYRGQILFGAIIGALVTMLVGCVL